jgi:hypothetical protein
MEIELNSHFVRQKKLATAGKARKLSLFSKD